MPAKLECSMMELTLTLMTLTFRVQRFCDSKTVKVNDRLAQESEASAELILVGSDRTMTLM